jgi:hypothetical protein
VKRFVATYRSRVSFAPSSSSSSPSSDEIIFDFVEDAWSVVEDLIEEERSRAMAAAGVVAGQTSGDDALKDLATSQHVMARRINKRRWDGEGGALMAEEILMVSGRSE